MGNCFEIIHDLIQKLGSALLLPCRPNSRVPMPVRAQSKRREEIRTEDEGQVREASQATLENDAGEACPS
eukprot:1145094-Pelagomonas_calceolata.AAC.7